MHSLIGFISDAHGNGRAFDRGVSLLLQNGAAHIFFLGDAIGYIPSTAVLDSLERLGNAVECIRGNHEAMLLAGPINPAREPMYQLEALRPNLCRYLDIISSWPVLRRQDINGWNVLMVHGSPADPTYGYVYPDSDLASFSPEADWVFMGNTHHPFIRECGGTHYVNVGSCGMPRDDGRYGSVALFDPNARSVRILRFDISKECRQVLEQYPAVHPSVRDLFERKSPAVEGEMM